MKSITVFLFISVFATSFLHAQKKEETKPKKTVSEVLKELPDMLIAQPEAAPDTNANKLMEDNLSIVINPLWKEKGLQSIIEYKLQKTDFDPLVSTFPLSSKKLVQGLTINMNTIKKTFEEKKQMILADVKKHMLAYYKEAGMTADPKEITEKVNASVFATEQFKTAQGKDGVIYYINDIEKLQSNFTTLMVVNGNIPNTTSFVQINYFHYNYETTFPEDLLEWRMFPYEEDRQEYVDFTKKILKTFVIK